MKFILFSLLLSCLLHDSTYAQKNNSQQFIGEWQLKDFVQTKTVFDPNYPAHASASFIFSEDSLYKTITAVDTSSGKWYFNTAKQTIMLKQEHDNAWLGLALLAFSEHQFTCVMNSTKGKVQMRFIKK